MAWEDSLFVANRYDVKKISENVVEIREIFYPQEGEFTCVNSMKVPIRLLEDIIRLHKGQTDN